MKKLLFIGALIMPNPQFTPGDIDHNVTQGNIKSTICVSGYSKKVRHVSVSMKKQVFKLYGFKYEPSKYEVDHLISLELGGSNDIKNLWPESYEPPGAREKDKVENRLHWKVCHDQMQLKEAQDIISKDWLGYYQRNFK